MEPSPHSVFKTNQRNTDVEVSQLKTKIHAWVIVPLTRADLESQTSSDSSRRERLKSVPHRIDSTEPDGGTLKQRSCVVLAPHKVSAHSRRNRMITFQ